MLIEQNDKKWSALLRQQLRRSRSVEVDNNTTKLTEPVEYARALP